MQTGDDTLEGPLAVEHASYIVAEGGTIRSLADSDTRKCTDPDRWAVAVAEQKEADARAIAQIAEKLLTTAVTAELASPTAAAS